MSSTSTRVCDNTRPVQCSALRKGGYAMLQDVPCKIISMQVSQPGKHGSSKVRIIGRSLLSASNKRVEDIYASTAMVQVPEIMKQEMQLIGIDSDGFMSLLTDAGVLTSSLRLPDSELGEKIEKLFREDDGTVLVQVQSLFEEDTVVGCRKDKD